MTLASAGEPLVRMRGIVKRFPGVLANDHVDFDLLPGEIHALLGENGAGKTTLMNILYGIYQPDEGEIIVRGRRVRIRSPRDAIRQGIGMVHQHFLLVDKHTVAENLAMGYARSFLNPLKEVKARIRDLGERYGIRVDPDAYVWQLSVGEQQRVEIVKALYPGADILVLDEPTSVLTPQEAEDLFEVLGRMRDDGKGIVFITHKLPEVFRVADRVTVMRRGRVVGTLPIERATRESLARMMVGREVVFELERPPSRPGKPVLVVRDLVVQGDSGRDAVRGISFEVREGEIFGIAGVAGNGQKELVHAIVGLRRVKSGSIRVMGVEVANRSPREIAELGVGHIPEERLRLGIVPDMSVAENSVLKSYYRPPYRRGVLLDYGEIRRTAESLIEEYEIDAPSPDARAGLLSGGNIQKLIVGRELTRDPTLIVASNPTFGLDVGATERTRRLLLRKRAEGRAILLVSGDLDEVIQLSDRLAVMYEGRFVGIVEPDRTSRERIGLMMSGSEMEVAQ